MTVLILAVIIALVMIGLSVRANSRFRDESRLPMQWSLSGAPCSPTGAGRRNRSATIVNVVDDDLCP